ncbi:MAG: peptide deformylase, partial [Methanomicrobiales archaeon]|nr:peptide deformylase [Methanomicrobiales archaeon]
AVCVRRPVSLSVRFMTREGTPDIWEDVDPDLASLVRHEVDQLDGILTLDRAGDPGMVVPWEVLQENYRRER